MKIKRLISDPIFQVSVAALSIALPALLKYGAGVDLQAHVPDDIDVNAAIPIVVILSLLLFNALRFVVGRFILPRKVICHDVRYLYSFSENGDFEASITNQIENRSGRSLDRVPNETLVWNRDLNDGQVFFKIVYRDGDKPHTFRNKGHKVDPIDIVIDRLRGKSPYSVTWSPEVEPEIGKGEQIAYEVLISTPGTELDAFSDGGTTMGFPVSLHTVKAKLLAKAPFGFEFRFVDPAVEVIDMDSGLPMQAEIADIQKPVLSDDKGLIEWELSKPKVNRRYWINYRFARKAL